MSLRTAKERVVEFFRAPGARVAVSRESVSRLTGITTPTLELVLDALKAEGVLEVTPLGFWRTCVGFDYVAPAEIAARKKAEREARRLAKVAANAKPCGCGKMISVTSSMCRECYARRVTERITMASCACGKAMTWYSKTCRECYLARGEAKKIAADLAKALRTRVLEGRDAALEEASDVAHARMAADLVAKREARAAARMANKAAKRHAAVVANGEVASVALGISIKEAARRRNRDADIAAEISRRAASAEKLRKRTEAEAAARAERVAASELRRAARDARRLEKLEGRKKPKITLPEFRDSHRPRVDNPSPPAPADASLLPPARDPWATIRARSYGPRPAFVEGAIRKLTKEELMTGRRSRRAPCDAAAS